MSHVRWAPNIYKQLQGVFCVYKPTGKSTRRVVEEIQINLENELNSLPCYKHQLIDAKKQALVLPLAANNKEKSLMLNTKDEVDLTEHRLVLGKRYIADDFMVRYLGRLNTRSSGVLLMGLGGQGMEMLKLISMAMFIRVYHVKGKLGYATMDSWHDGKFVQRTSYRHITKPKMDKICSAAQSGHQRLMFEYAGINQDTEEAYKLASGGMIRPQNTKTPPLLYSVKCIYFEPPDFTLEVHSINEKCDYLANFVHDLGVRLKSTAVCTHIHRIRHGYFNLDHTLLKKDWNVAGIQRNMRELRPLLQPRKILTSLEMRGSSKDNKVADSFDEESQDDIENMIKKALKESVKDQT